ncbi:MAG: penicillin acylase family protein [Betaproteobacteria bacterium]|nr:penicillin acylase family protein [Betaproteobacteria bacterium]
MKRWARRIGLSLAALLVLVALVLLAAWIYLRQSLPGYQGEVKLAGLAGPVEVVRDAHAVPHIQASSWDDAWFALGYVHAQDRLWQMEMNRRIASGRVAEVVGERGLEIDKFMRTLGMRRVAEQNSKVLAPEARRGMERYAAGVNAFLANRKGPLPPEFVIFGITPEPWSVVDSIAWGKMMQWDLSGNWRGELLRLRLSSRLSPTQIAEFLPPYRGDAFNVLPELKTLHAAAEDLGEIADKLAQAVPAAPEHAVGSNNWVVAGARSTSGKPLLANDPHLGLSAPAIWYFAHLGVNGENLIGATFPGVPSIVLGRNDHIAWGVTNTGPDVQDLYLERLDEKDSASYVAPDGSRKFSIRQEQIKVRGSEAVTINVRETRNGPVISDVVASAGTAAPKGHVLSFRWTALLPDDALANASHRLQFARDWNGFRESLREFHGPQQSFVYADVQGNIGFIAPGRIPVRAKENTLQGLAPALGWDARYDWKGFIPFEELPQAYNPAEGMVVTANHKIVPREYSHHIAFDWATPHRADRIRERIVTNPRHDLGSFADIQGDVVSLSARELLPLMLAAEQASARAKAWQARLKAWDANLTADRAEPLVYWAWWRELTRLVYADELGPVLFRDGWEARVSFMKAVLEGASGADGTPQSRWCDNIDTPAQESCASLLAQALALALTDLDKRFGADESAWRWGEAHFAHSEHRPLGGVPVLERLANIRVPTGGDGYTVNAAANRIGNAAMPYANRHAASLRAIYDLADLDRSHFMHSTGQSGNPLSPWYAHFAEPWSKNQSVPMTTQRSDYERDAIGTLRLKPE